MSAWRSVAGCFLLVLLLGAGGHAVAAESAGWQALWDNRLDEAAEVFSDTTPLPAVQALTRLEGRFLLAMMRGDDEAQWQIAGEQFRLAASQEGDLGRVFLVRLLNLAQMQERPLDLTKVLEEVRAAQQTRLSGAMHWRLRVILQRLYREQRRYDDAAALEGQGDFIRQYARVIGPYRFPVSRPGIDHPLPPETTPGASTFADAQGFPVTVTENPQADRDGDMVLSYQTSDDPIEGWTYAQLCLESETDQDVVLICRRADDMKIWLRGQVIGHPDQYRFAYAQSNRPIRVHLRKGRNPFLVKCNRDDWLRFSVRGVSLEDAPGVKAVKFDPADWQGLSCCPARGVVLSAPWESPSLATLSDLSESIPAGRIWRALMLEEDGHWPEARAVWDALLAEAPESQVALNLLAQARLREVSAYIDSPDRLRKEAVDFLEKARALDARDIPATLSRAALFLEGDQSDRAQQLLTLLDGMCPQSIVRLRLLTELYDEERWRALQLKVAKELHEAYPGNWSTYESALRTTGQDAAADALLARMWQERRLGARRWFRDLLKKQAFAEAEAVYTQYCEQFPRYLQFAEDGALQLARERGDMQSLEKVLLRRADANPYDPAAAQSLGEYYLQQGTEESVHWAETWLGAALERSELAGDRDHALARRLRALRGTAWGALAYDLPLSSVDHASVTKDDHPRANYATILRVLVRRVFPDGSTEGIVHHAVKVFDNEGIGALSELSLPEQAGDVLFCRTVQPDGTVFVPTSVENIDLGKATSMYRVEAGSVIDYAYREVEGATDEYYDFFEAQDFDTPVIRSRYVLILPADLYPQISLKCYPESMHPSVTRAGEDVILQWDVKDQLGKKPEPFMPQAEPLFSSVLVNLPLERPVYAGYAFAPEAPVWSNDQIAEKAQTLGEGHAPGSRAAVEAVYNWIAQTIREGGQARTARDAFFLGMGDEGTKLALCKAMLDALGFTSEFAKVNMPLSLPGTGPRRERAALAGNFYDPELLRVEVADGPDCWLRFPSPSRNFRMGDLGANISGAYALSSGTEGFRLRRVNGESTEAVSEDRREYRLQPDGTANLKASLRFFGTLSGHMRTQVEDVQRARMMMEGMVSSEFPAIEISSLAYGSDETPEGEAPRTFDPFFIQVEGTIRGFARREGERLGFQPFRAGSGAQNVLVPMPREEPFEIAQDFISQQTAVFVAPEGWAFSDVPEDTVIDCELGYYRADFDVDGRRLTVSRLLILPTQQLPARQYESLHRLCADIKRFEDRGISLRPLPLSSFGGLQTPYHNEGPVRGIVPGRYMRKEWPEGLPHP